MNDHHSDLGIAFATITGLVTDRIAGHELAPWEEITDTTRAILTLAWSTARTVTRALVDAGMS